MTSSSSGLTNKLETILHGWKFPLDIIEKYKSLKIVEIFDWQAECLNNYEVLTSKKY